MALVLAFILGYTTLGGLSAASNPAVEWEIQCSLEIRGQIKLETDGRYLVIPKSLSGKSFKDYIAF